MRCKKCSAVAAINMRSHKLSLCSNHFLDFFVERVRKTLERYQMLSEQKKPIIIAVSGGKDSLALWHTLKLLGINTFGLHIDLGISKNDYSKISRKKTEVFALKNSLPLLVLSLSDEVSFTIDEYRRVGKRTACSTCGLVKRHIMNSFVTKMNAQAIATGHNLDDEVGVLLSNLLNWQLSQLARQEPTLHSWHPKLAKKIKPLCEISDKESAAYVYLSKIDNVQVECPYSRRATFLACKEVLNKLEERSPGTKLRFYRGHLKNKSIFGTDRNNLIDCEECGLPSTVVPCAFCRLKKRILEA